METCLGWLMGISKVPCLGSLMATCFQKLTAICWVPLCALWYWCLQPVPDVLFVFIIDMVLVQWLMWNWYWYGIVTALIVSILCPWLATLFWHYCCGFSFVAGALALLQ